MELWRIMADIAPSGITREFHGDSADILAALEAVLSSESFSSADRLKNFLEYVVTEAINGRADAIKGKTIALDVYDRNAATDGDPENVVRVDARRLRRRLSDYYAGEGKDARIRIHIDSGGYAPRFEHVDDPQNRVPVSAPSRHKTPPSRLTATHLFIGTLAVVFAVVFVIGYGALFPAADTTADLPSERKLQRQALLEKSPAALQAVTMAAQARDIMLPLFDLTRQKLSLGLFQQAISLDPGHSGGYAGAAQALGTLAVLSPPGEQKADFRKQSLEMANKAIELNPTNPWSQSAASWSRYANNDHDEAVRLSALAYAMAPNNLQILEIYGAVALWNGEFDLVVRVLEDAAMNPLADSRSGVGNVYGAAQFFLGNHREALKALSISAESGGPISPASVAIQAAASHALGDLSKAREYAADLQETWPSVPMDQLFRQLFRYPAHAEAINRRVYEAGWRFGSADSAQ